MLNGPGHSTEECKVLKDCSAKYAAQRPHNKREARSGGKKKRGNTVKFDGTTEEVNRTTAHDAPIPGKKREKIRQRILRVKRTLHIKKKSNVLMGLTA